MRADQFWAKLDKREPSKWHPLIAHSADVAAVGGRLLQRDSPISSRLAKACGWEILPPWYRALLTFLIGIHDFGKANHGFQDRRLPSRSRQYPKEGHVAVVFGSLEHLPLMERLERVLTGVLHEDCDPTALFTAAVAHHGTPIGLMAPKAGVARLWSRDERTGRDPLREVDRILGCTSRWAELARMPSGAHLPSSPTVTHLFAGLVTLSDWIGSTEVAFPFNPGADDDPDQYWKTEALPRAERAVGAIGLVPRTCRVSSTGSELYSRMFPEVFGADGPHHPNGLQLLTAEMDVPSPGSRVLIEAATGSGKTEAALALWARLRSENRVGGLMFALPTRATAHAMFGRVEAAVRALFGPTAPQVTLAVGGAVPLDSRKEAAGVTVPQTYAEDDLQWRKLTAWATEHHKRFLASEIVVGTIDQALLGGLAIRHAHMRLAGLSRHFLVVDEVHSHDRYMLEVLRNLLSFQSHVGGVALLMSATLSSSARDILAPAEADPGSLEEEIARPYPSLAVAAPGGGWRIETVSTGSKSRSISWALGDEDQGIREALAAARSGARVCILRNLVRDARRTVNDLLERGHGELLWRPPGTDQSPPYHAQYASGDRRRLDAEILREFGKGASSVEGGSIVVATQVVEQSLDVDFDYLVTDLAPVEILVQRLGRLHRHLGRTRSGARPHGYEVPNALVLGPPEPFNPRPAARGDHGWGTVYRDWAPIELTRRLVAQNPTISLPEESRRLLESVYHPEAVSALRAEAGWGPVLDESEGVGLCHSLQAHQCILRFDQTYQENAERYRDESSIRTRLGDDTVMVQLTPSVRCWYADEYESFVPRRSEDVAKAGLDLSDPCVGPGQPDENGTMQYPFGKGTLAYEPTGWVHRRGD